MTSIILPQAIRNILPATGNEFVINIKDTSVLNVISVSELFFKTSVVSTGTFNRSRRFCRLCAVFRYDVHGDAHTARDRAQDGGPKTFTIHGSQTVPRPRSKSLTGRKRRG